MCFILCEILTTPLHKYHTHATIPYYQSPLILTELFQQFNKRFLSHACYLYQVMMTLHFLNDVANDAESILKSKLRHNR